MASNTLAVEAALVGGAGVGAGVVTTVGALVVGPMVGADETVGEAVVGAGVGIGITHAEGLAKGSIVFVSPMVLMLVKGIMKEKRQKKDAVL